VNEENFVEVNPYIEHKTPFIRLYIGDEEGYGHGKNLSISEAEKLASDLNKAIEKAKGVSE